MALFLKAGTAGYTFIDVDNNVTRKFTLKRLQSLIGGYIEIVKSNEDGYVLVCNAEGKLNSLPYNNEASKLLENKSDYIVGDSVFCKSSDID